MTRGLYIAATGLIDRTRAINVTANNITNSQTAGYKRDGLLSESFGNYLTYKLSNRGSGEIGSITHGVVQGGAYTLFDQGPLQQTGKTTDLAIEEEGFFTLQTIDYQRRLTRSGQFAVDENGYLSDPSGNLVLGIDGPLMVGTSDFSVDKDGVVSSRGERIGQLLISVPNDPAFLVKEEGTQFLDLNPQWEPGVFTGNIRQGFLEASNVETTDEMTDMISSSRAYQTCSQIVKMIDGIMQKTVNEIARL